MNMHDFMLLKNEVYSTGDQEKLLQLCEVAKTNPHPRMYHHLADFFKPNAFTILHSGYPSDLSKKLLTDIFCEDISDIKKYNDYTKKCFNAFKVSAENGEFEYVPELINFYKDGHGTKADIKKAKYWVGKLYDHSGGVTVSEWVSLEYFQKKFDEIVQNGDALKLKKLCADIGENSYPTMYQELSMLYDSDCELYVDGEEVGEIVNDVINATIKDVVSSNYYAELCFHGTKRRAEAGDYNLMSTLAEFYQTGFGTRVNAVKAEFWYDKLYIYKTGMTFKKYMKKQT